MARPELTKAFEVNRAAIAVADLRHPDAIKASAHINGTAYTALRIVQREVLDTALRYRNARRLWGETVARPHKVALFALLRVRREMRDAYPSARPLSEGLAA